MSKKEKGVISDDARIVASIPTIEYLLDAGASVILMSHMGRPKGTPNPDYSLRPVADRLSELLHREVKFLPSDHVVDAEVEKAVKALKPGEVALLENTRYRAEEERTGKSSRSNSRGLPISLSTMHSARLIVRTLPMSVSRRFYRLQWDYSFRRKSRLWGRHSKRRSVLCIHLGRCESFG